MRNLICTVALCLFSTAVGFAQPKTVTDYFLAMPANVYSTTISGEKFKSKTELVKFRRSLIKIEDVKNGYLRLEGPWEGWAEIALFKRADGSYLIAESSVGCGPACDGSLKIYTYTAGKWTDVSAKYVPKLSAKQIFDAYRKNGGNSQDVTKAGDIGYFFVLPREGRVMKAVCNMCSEDTEDFTLFDYEWNGATFVKK